MSRLERFSMLMQFAGCRATNSGQCCLGNRRISHGLFEPRSPSYPDMIPLACEQVTNPCEPNCIRLRSSRVAQADN